MSTATAEPEVRSEICHFKIDPTWLVERLRELWIEREFGKAIKIIDAGFPTMTLEDKIYILTGKKTLVYSDSPDAVERSEYTLVGDDWSPTGYYNGMKVPTWLDVVEQSQFCEDNKEAFEALKDVSVLAWCNKGIPITKGPGSYGRSKAHGTPRGYISASYVVELLCRFFPPPTNEQWESFWERNIGAVDDIIAGDNSSFWRDQSEQFEKKIELAKKVVPDSALAAQWGPSTATNIEIYMAHQRDLETRSCPPPDTELQSEDGWILPDGKFYPCGYMEHIWLVEKLGKKSEKAAEDSGWIKIHHSLDGTLWISRPSDREMPQKQMNTLWDWCQKHNAPYPTWAKHNE